MVGSTGLPSLVDGFPLLLPELNKLAKTTRGTGELNDRVPPPKEDAIPPPLEKKLELSPTTTPD
jgi:hypothetical protein